MIYFEKTNDDRLQTILENAKTSDPENKGLVTMNTLIYPQFKQDKKILLLDLGGVLVDVCPGRTAVALQQLTHIPSKFFLTLIQDWPIKTAHDIGQITQTTFWENFLTYIENQMNSSMLGGSNHLLGKANLAKVSKRRFFDAWQKWILPKPHILRFLTTLKAKYKLYMLSNTDPIHFQRVKSIGRHWLDLFDGLHLSFQVGQVKPDYGFYQSALSKFSVSKTDCVFIDDTVENIAAARRLGIDSVRVTEGGLDAHLVEYLMNSWDTK